MTGLYHSTEDQVLSTPAIGVRSITPSRATRNRAAKLSLLNFLSLFRDLGGGVVAEMFRDLQTRRESVGGGSSRHFSGHRHSICFRARETPEGYTPRHRFRKILQKRSYLRRKKYITKIPSIPGDFGPFPGDLEITRHFWRLTEIPGDLAGLQKPSIPADRELPL